MVEEYVPISSVHKMTQLYTYVHQFGELFPYFLNSSLLGFRKTTGEGSGTPLQYSCLENPMDGGAWKAT